MPRRWETGRSCDPEEEDHPGKTVKYDLSVVFDNLWLNWIGALRVLHSKSTNVQKSKPEPRTAFGPISMPTLQSLDGQVDKIQNARRRQKPRLVETRQKCSAIRKGEQAGFQRSTTPKHVDRARRRMRETSRGYFDPRANSCASRGPWQGAIAPGCYVADVSCGKESLRYWNSRFGRKGDINNPAILR